MCTLSIPLGYGRSIPPQVIGDWYPVAQILGDGGVIDFPTYFSLLGYFLIFS